MAQKAEFSGWLRLIQDESRWLEALTVEDDDGMPLALIDDNLRSIEAAGREVRVTIEVFGKTRAESLAEGPELPEIYKTLGFGKTNF